MQNIFLFFLQNIFQWKHNWTENQRSFHWVHCIFVANVVFSPSASVMFRPILRWICVCVQSCLNLCDPIDYSPLGCSVHGILQARMLEWVAISSSWGSSWSRDPTCISCIFCIAGRFFIAEPLRSPKLFFLSSVQFSCSVVSDSLQPYEPQHARPPCPSPTPGVYSNSCPSSWWCHPTISSSVIPFSSCLQSFPASGSFPMSQLFTSVGQSIGVSASTSVLPMNTQD